MVAADRVVMDTLRVRLGLICGFTFLSGTIPKAHLLLMGLMFFTNSFLLLICRQGHLEMVVYLMKQGADPASLDIEGSVTLELSLKKCFAVWTLKLGHMEEDCLITMFSENKRFSSFFSKRPIKFKVQLSNHRRPFELTWSLRKQHSNNECCWSFCTKKTCECFVIRKCCDWTIFF